MSSPTFWVQERRRRYVSFFFLSNVVIWPFQGNISNSQWSLTVCFHSHVWHPRTSGFGHVITAKLTLPSPQLLDALYSSLMILRWWRLWMSCTNCWGAAPLASMCRPCCWSGGRSSCTACCSTPALGTRSEKESSGWERPAGPTLPFFHLAVCNSKLPRDVIAKTYLTLLPFVLQILYRILKSERVSERNKQRVKLKDFGYLGLVCFLEDIPVTMTTVQCLYVQVLATGNVG